MEIDRKARLAQLRALKEQAEATKTAAPNAAEDDTADEIAEDAPKKLSFRNYDPLSSHLKSLKRDDTDIPEETLETRAKKIEEEAVELQKAVIAKDVELTSLAPKKPGFDLARDLEQRTEKLEKETAYCIAENIRKRLKSSKDISEIASDAHQNGTQFDEDEE